MDRMQPIIEKRQHYAAPLKHLAWDHMDAGLAKLGVDDLFGVRPFKGVGCRAVVERPWELLQHDVGGIAGSDGALLNEELQLRDEPLDSRVLEEERAHVVVDVVVHPFDVLLLTPALHLAGRRQLIPVRLHLLPQLRQAFLRHWRYPGYLFSSTSPR